MTTTKNNPTLLTLEEIKRQKRNVLHQIRTQKQSIDTTASRLFAPVKSSNKFELMMNSINSGIAMYDGVMTGLRLMRRVRGWFKK